MKTVATYYSALEANIAKGRLEAEGIDSHLADQHVVQVGYAIAPGGIRLQVAPGDLLRARGVLGQDYSEILAAHHAELDDDPAS